MIDVSRAWRSGRHLVCVAICAALVSLASGCADDAPLVGESSVPPVTPGAAADAPSSVPARSPVLGGAQAGSLKSVEPLPDISPDISELGASATRIIYQSTGTSGEPTTVSGVVVVPSGVPPKGGWPLISFGHGTTGVENNCGPSRYSNLLGSDKLLAAFVLEGFAVTMSDYQGLGVPGFVHPYLDSKVLGYNIIDAVKAARHFSSAIGPRWSSYGVSLGGMAAWAAADQLGGGYPAGDTQLVGTASLVPVSDMRGLADEAWAGTLTRAQYPLLIYTLDSLAKLHPDMQLDDYRSGVARTKWSQYLECFGPDTAKLPELLAQLKPADLKPAGVDARDRLREYLADYALPQHKASGPLLVLYGTTDDLINADWTKQSLTRACDLGSVVQYQRREGEGHADLDSSASVSWVKSRFLDVAPINTCGSER
ncbi:lipase family protein [Williamsia sterculiae]|uniref:Secretory lipase n=1 Tax=Williamsia sterculiae TaxID=1344003 RepID=A0A1N7D058_9NOCA|nr:lipase family protein [Williamsia sterculiae]SIR69104.1 Secretory lipase [Williamsia sterculiae]